jgi:deoxycytidine triphosphate deaminase
LIQLSWKSSLARIWLIVHNTAWVINPWNFLNITFELCNLNKVPIIIRPWMEIAQLLFSKISCTPEKLYHQTWRYVKDNWTGYVSKE